MSDISRAEIIEKLNNDVPYIKHLGLIFDLDGTEFTAHMPFKPELIGNPLIPAIHGGVIAAMMELTALSQLVLVGGYKKVPKTIDIGVDYLRSGRPETIYAKAEINRIGRNISNIEVRAWQSNAQEIIAKLHGHFLLVDEN